MIGKRAVVWFGLVVLLALVGPISAEPPPAWLKDVKILPPGKFPLPKAVKAFYRGSWIGITSGQVRTAIKPEKQKLHFSAQGETTGAARLLFELDASMDSKLDPKTLHPATTWIIENYSDEKRKTTQTFDAEKVVRVRSTKPRQKDDGKPKAVHLPGIFDLAGALLYIRSQPLRIGDQISFLAYATGSPYLATVTVEGAETIKVPQGTHPARRLTLHLQSIDKKLQLAPYAKARALEVWISDDADRLFLRFRGDLLIGSALVELEKVEWQ